MRTIIWVVVSVVLAGARGAHAQPSSTLSDYVLFAEELMKPNALLVPCGDIGVNSPIGIMRERNGITVAGNCVANTARMDGLGSCNELFANSTVEPTQTPTPFTPPVITGSIATNCGYPGSFPTCNLGQSMTVDAGTTMSLPPGTYGDVTVKGGYDELMAPNPGILQLQGGTYTFCNVKINHFSQIRTLAPSTVNLAGKLKMQGGNYFGPNVGTVASDVVIYVSGTKVRYARNSQVVARVCAPQAVCGLLDGGTHFGAVYCRKLKVRDSTFSCASPSGAFVD